MKIVILSGGRGTRMMPLTIDTPKPMLKVKGKTLLDHKLEALPWEEEDFIKNTEEIIFIIGYNKDKIIQHFQNLYYPTINNNKTNLHIPIRYIEQNILDGTAGAINLCKELLTDKFLVLSGDDIYHKDDIKNFYKYSQDAMLIFDKGLEGLDSKGQVIIDDKYNFIGLNEGIKQSQNTSSLINAGCYILTEKYFNTPMQKVSDNEYGLPHTLLELTKKDQVKTHKAKYWLQITTPQDIEMLNNKDDIWQ